ncbi:DIS3-like exonuclease 2 [Battus philenor]|uniref:DIS3-like exonuclease 2 n=1 Tax=Battus philenor TaxID=42288 RepID=UPI0035CEB175
MSEDNKSSDNKTSTELISSDKNEKPKATQEASTSKNATTELDKHDALKGKNGTIKDNKCNSPKGKCAIKKETRTNMHLETPTMNPILPQVHTEPGISKQQPTATQEDAISNKNATDEKDKLNALKGKNGTVKENKCNSPKGKNSKKKELLKNMHLEMPNVNTIQPQVHTSPGMSRQQNHYQLSSVHELFHGHLGSLYGVSHSQYLENLSYHPHYQYAQSNYVNMVRTHNQIGSLPNSPLSNSNCTLHPWSNPNTPLFNEQISPRFLQNVLQHPLLNQTYSRHNNIHFREEQNPVTLNCDTNSKNTPTKKRSKKKDLEEKSFEPYLKAEEVDTGLKDNTLVEGILRINPKQFQHAYVSSSDRSLQDILIDGIRNRNRALEGDVVIVQILNQPDDSEESKQKKGKVVYIKEKVHTRTCIGLLKLMPDKNRQRALFVPRDHRVPRLNIPFTCWPDNFYVEAKSYENTLFLAEIDNWNDTRFAVGKIVCNIGQSGDMLTEAKAILAQTDLDVTPFGPEVRDLYPRLDYVIPTEEILVREDCRKLCIFSIDPQNCRDIDDAISCKILENGNYEIGVHISDVSHFLSENTVLDEKVAEKATTIYLVEKAYHMLPDDLCMLCSLFPGVDKLAFSVFWEISDDANVLNKRFAKTVIHSCCQLSYDHAQAVLDNKKDAEASFPEIYNGFKFQDVCETIKILGKLSSIFRKSRFDNGALRIDQPKASFHLNPSTGLPDSLWIYESKESHQLIEEFMLLANMTVAKKIYDDHPKLAFLRCHPPPSGYMLQQLAKSLKPIGIELDISSAGSLYHSLLQYIGPDSTDKGKAMVLNMLCAKPMTRAKYFCAGGCTDDDFHHYALNVPLYTHFTSPIRRYADIMVHRLLSASLNYRDAPKWEIDKVRMIAAQCNKQKYNAKRANELSTELYTLKYIEMNSPFVTEAVVVEVREKYIDVIIVTMGLNRRIFFNNDFPGDHTCIKNDAGVKLSKMELLWKATENLPVVKQVIEVFSIIKVELNRDEDMVKVDTKLVRPV